MEGILNKKDVSFKIEISPDNQMEAFGAYLSPSANEGTAKINLNFNASLGCAIEEGENFYEILSESTLHEVLHALEDIFKKVFDEEKIEKIVEENRKNLKKETTLDTINSQHNYRCCDCRVLLNKENESEWEVFTDASDISYRICKDCEKKRDSDNRKG